MRSETTRPIVPPPPREAEITVLAAARGVLRAGTRVLTLARWMARRPTVVGHEVAVTARLLDQLPVAPAVVVVVGPGVAVQTCVDDLVSGVRGMLGDTGAVTVNVTCPVPAVPEPTGGLTRYNQPVDALPGVLVDAVTAGRRDGLTTGSGNCVLLLQRFVPTGASAVVHASPYRGTPVHVDGRSLPRDTGRQLAALAKDAAVTAGMRLVLDIAVGEHGPVVLRCRPSPGERMSRTGTNA